MNRILRSVLALAGTVGLTAGLTLGGAPAAVANPGAVLTQVALWFHTNDEDKDDDTHVTVQVFDRNTHIVASIDNDFGHFDDHSDHGPYFLTVANQSLWDDLRSGGTAQITISPNGHDTWRFNFRVDLLFSDNSHLGASVNGIELTQDRSSQKFGIH